MARLNEPPIAPAPAPAPPTETVDAVKRRCLRQNRELAKINSQQSIRIRTLENDASRLLAENLSLREQVLQLQNALEAQASRPSFEDLDSVKQQLEAKLQEFGSVLAGLGEVNKKDTRPPRCKSQLAATRRNPDERQWRSGLCLQEVENAMLPTIAEDKFYPRRTMNADELRNILENPESQESPDIGPPPVSRFESEDPISFNPDPPPEGEATDPTEEHEPELPLNLETRRKRRESGPGLSIRRESVFASPPEEKDGGITKTVRAGAKRKFSVQEDEDKSRPQTDPFRYSRRNAPAPDESTTSSRQSRPRSPERSILGSKPVNTESVLSPKKKRSSAAEKPEKPEKKPLPKTGHGRLSITRHIVSDLQMLEVPPPISVAELKLDSMPPRTPAADIIFSPPTTEPSTSRPESNDTPPPGDIGSGSQVSTGARPARRARPQVSYKEPSLNTKMRRPGKELIDAVISDHGSKNSVDTQVGPSAVGTMSIKQEPEDSAWKPIGAGAVVGRMGEETVKVESPLRQKMDRNESTQDPRPDAPKLNSAAASHAISALISETSTTKRKPPIPLPILPWKTNTESLRQVDSTKKQDDLAVFDFNESSPATTDGYPTSAAACSRPRIDLAKAARNARRHSSVPASAAAAAEERRSEASARAEKPERADGALPAVHKRTASGTVRSSGASNPTKSVAAARTLPKDRESRERNKSGLPTSASSVSLAAKVDSDGTGSMRAERAAIRRKSMMI